MRVAITPNPTMRHGHAEAVLNQIGIPAMYRDERNRIVTILSQQQLETWGRMAGAHSLEILDGDETAALTQPQPQSDFVMQAVPGEPIHVRLERERIIRERVYAANIPLPQGSPATLIGEVPAPAEPEAEAIPEAEPEAEPAPVPAPAEPEAEAIPEAEPEAEPAPEDPTAEGDSAA